MGVQGSRALGVGRPPQVSSRTGLTASMEPGLCVQRERRRGEGRGLGWVLGGKGGWAGLRSGPPGC